MSLTTNGGDPDAGYKISRYLQDHYDKFTILVSGICKSAGTLVAIGASEIAFTPYGELGPLDIQMTRKDNVTELHSGLNINEALLALEAEGISRYFDLISSIFDNSRGIITFKTAADAAADVCGRLYEPIMAQIDPEEVGKRVRSMRIASDYGKRLSAKVRSVKPNALRQLAETYPSHGFVIDSAEAQNLFTNVRPATEVEMALVGALGATARWEQDRATFACLSSGATATEEETNGKRKPRSGAARKDAAYTDGATPQTPVEPQREDQPNAGGSGGETRAGAPLRGH